MPKRYKTKNSGRKFTRGATMTHYKNVRPRPQRGGIRM